LFEDRGPLHVLDIGCGHAKYRRFMSDRGHKYVGVDLRSRAADVRVDAHLLPFSAFQFDAALLFSVLQYSLKPHLVLEEAHRVLRPAGTLTGCVAFLEPAVWDGLMHLSALGLVTLLRQSDFEVQYLWPSWNVFEAVSSGMRESVAMSSEKGDLLQKTESLGESFDRVLDETLDFSGAIYFHAVKESGK
jgi:ubiquinone/menaquinone biosynthesis C-methylase UbiE